MQSKEMVLGRWNGKVSKARVSLAHVMRNSKSVGVAEMNIPAVRSK